MFDLKIDINSMLPSPQPGPDEFKCQYCKEIFGKRWSDEAAMAEAKENFPNDPLTNTVVICDDCYKIFMTMKNKESAAQ